MTTLEPADLADLREYIRVQVAAGFDPVPAVVDEAVTVFADTTLPPDDLHRAAVWIADEVLAAQLADQVAWPVTTDNDRLDRAFAALDAAGIVARQHFSCCGDCGNTDIRDEMDRMAKDGLPVRGYTFFHVQDTEYAIDGESLFLSFGSTDGVKEAGEAIGHEIVGVLKDHGLEPAWNGRHANRIGLPIVWQRRR